MSEVEPTREEIRESKKEIRGLKEVSKYAKKLQILEWELKIYSGKVFEVKRTTFKELKEDGYLYKGIKQILKDEFKSKMVNLKTKKQFMNDGETSANAIKEYKRQFSVSDLKELLLVTSLLNSNRDKMIALRNKFEDKPKDKKRYKDVKVTLGTDDDAEVMTYEQFVKIRDVVYDASSKVPILAYSSKGLRAPASQNMEELKQTYRPQIGTPLLASLLQASKIDKYVKPYKVEYVNIPGVAEDDILSVPVASGYVFDAILLDYFQGDGRKEKLIRETPFGKKSTAKYTGVSFSGSIIEEVGNLKAQYRIKEDFPVSGQIPYVKGHNVVPNDKGWSFSKIVERLHAKKSATYNVKKWPNAGISLAGFGLMQRSTLLSFLTVPGNQVAEYEIDGEFRQMKTKAYVDYLRDSDMAANMYQAVLTGKGKQKLRSPKPTPKAKRS